MPFGNVILDAIDPTDLAAIRPHLTEMTLQQQTVLYDPGDMVKRVYFPTTSIVSLVVTLSTGEVVEAAMVGRDGVVGAAAGLDGQISLMRAIVQLSGDAYSCDVGLFKEAVLESR